QCRPLMLLISNTSLIEERGVFCTPVCRKDKFHQLKDLYILNDISK
ncbi:13721_t:CDS:2, partial [Cetraspora pellucida]